MLRKRIYRKGVLVKAKYKGTAYIRKYAHHVQARHKMLIVK